MRIFCLSIIVMAYVAVASTGIYVLCHAHALMHVSWGSFVDSRDGEKYRILRVAYVNYHGKNNSPSIDTLYVFAENLRYLASGWFQLCEKSKI